MDSSPASRPLSIEPVIGWRVWRLGQGDDGALALLSVTRSDAWPAREIARASCSAHPGQPAPSGSCACGLYAATSPEALASSRVFNLTTTVVGAIAMWGTVAEHEHGARAAKAYPARLRLVCAPCLAAGRGAVVPTSVVSSVSSMSSLVAVCRRHGLRAGSPIASASELQAELLSTYAVDLMPLERIERSLKVRGPVPGAEPKDALLKLVELVFQAIGLVINVVMTLLVISWVVAIVLGVGGWVVRLLLGAA